jgi:hypothetical protein
MKKLIDICAAGCFGSVSFRLCRDGQERNFPRQMSRLRV